MISTRTYRHNDADGKFVRWMTEVTVDKTTSHSRPATDDETAVAEAAEKRDARLAVYAANLAEGVDASAEADAKLAEAVSKLAEADEKLAAADAKLAEHAATLAAKKK